MTTPKLQSFGKVTGLLVKAHTAVVDASIMAAYYGLIHGDVRFTTGWTRTDAALVEKTLRPILGIKWSKNGKATRTTTALSAEVSGCYISDAKKRAEACEKLGVTPNNVKDAEQTSWEDFYSAAMKYYSENVQASRSADLADDEVQRQFYNKLAGMLEKALENGVTSHDLAVMVERVKAGKEIVRKAKPADETK